MKVPTLVSLLHLFTNGTNGFTILTPTTTHHQHTNNNNNNNNNAIIETTNDLWTPCNKFSKDSIRLSAVSIDEDAAPSTSIETKPKVQRYYETYRWNNPFSKETYDINYRVEGKPTDPPILLVHGFGANVNHFRNNFQPLTEAGYQVFAIDLLGFGGSDKPKDENYSIELWVQLLCDFIQAMKSKSSSASASADDDNRNRSTSKWVVAGNSIGGLCSLGVTSHQKELVRGCILFNCAQGMSMFREEEMASWMKPLVYFFRNVILNPDGYGGKFFENFKTKDNVESILMRQGVYGNTSNVNEELLEILLGPSNDDGAKEVFLKVFGGEAGPTPESYLKNIDQPILALWGSADPWVPVDRGNHQGRYFGNSTKGDYKLIVIDGVGHCPMDEAPDKIHEAMLPWLSSLPSE